MSRRSSRLEFPEDGRIQDALVLLLFEHGGELSALLARDTYRPLAVFFRLSDREQFTSRNDDLGDGRNEPYWHTKIQWAKQRLMEKGDLHCPQEGVWMLTENGKNTARRIRIAMKQIPDLSGTECFTKITALHLKSPSNLTLEDLGL